MSCCALVIDSDGVIHYVYEAGLTDKRNYVEPPIKAKVMLNGDVVMTVGTVRAGEKFWMDYENAKGDVMQINDEEFFMEKDKDEWEGDALIIKKDGSCFQCDGPFSLYKIKSPGFYAIGSGGNYAFGVLWSLLHGKKKVSANEAIKALKLAIEAACALDDNCALPATFGRMIPNEGATLYE